MIKDRSATHAKNHFGKVLSMLLLASENGDPAHESISLPAILESPDYVSMEV